MDTGHKWTDRELAALEERIATVYRRAYKDIGRTIRDYFDKFAARDDEQRARLDAGEITNAEYTRWRLTQMGRGERYKALQERVAERMYNANTVALAYVNDTTPGIYTLNRNWTAYTIEQAGANASFTLWDESTVRRLIVEQPQLMPNYPKAQAVRRGIDLAYSKRQIGSAVTSGILQGHSVGKIAAEVQRHVTDMSWTSATRAARTAVTAAQNGGRQDTYEAAQKMGIELKKEWVATLDNRTRHAHAMADGQVVAVDKPFRLDGYDLMFPGDKSAPGYLVYNCRCTTIAAFKDYGKDAKRRSIDVVGEDMTYQEWAENKTKQLASSNKTGTIKSIKVEDLRAAINGGEISDEVAVKIADVLEAHNGVSLFDNAVVKKLGPEVVFQTDAQKAGTFFNTVFVMNEDVLGGKTVAEIDAIFKAAKNTVADSLEDAVVHEMYHSKIIQGLNYAQVENLYDELNDLHIEGLSNTAYIDGAECIAEVGVLVERGDTSDIPQEAKKLFDKIFGG